MYSLSAWSLPQLLPVSLYVVAHGVQVWVFLLLCDGSVGNRATSSPKLYLQEGLAKIVPISPLSISGLAEVSSKPACINFNCIVHGLDSHKLTLPPEKQGRTPIPM